MAQAGNSTAGADLEASKELPAPEIDITKTSLPRSFAPGTAGPHMNVILHNKITLAKMLQDVRRNQNIILKNLHGSGKPAKSVNAKAEKPVEVEYEDDFFEALLEGSRRFMEAKGEMRLARGGRINSVVQKWEQALSADSEVGLAQEHKETLEEYSLQEKITLHLKYGEKLRGKKRASTSTLDEEDMGGEGAADVDDEEPRPPTKSAKKGKST